jgi:hypothetical protein
MTHFEKHGYMGEKRMKLVKKFGYDVKNASHLIRLLKMVIEYLNSGELTVFRTKDAPMLVDIKTGKWTLEEVKKEAERLFGKADEAYNKSSLPEEPDVDKVEGLVMDIILDHIYNYEA